MAWQQGRKLGQCRRLADGGADVDDRLGAGGTGGVQQLRRSGAAGRP